MSEPRPTLRRLVASTTIYAAAGLAQQAAGFLLIPLYTRRIAPNDYGVLEIFNSFSAIGFACLTIGLSSAINKCYHRDCHTADDRATLLATAILVDLPLLLLAGVAAVVCAQPISTWLTGTTTASSLVPLVTAAGICSGVGTLLLAWFRAQERARVFCALTLTQFATALGLNVVLVAVVGAGVRGVFWGALVSNLLLIALATFSTRGSVSWKFNPRLLRPLLSFGLYLIPAMLAGWVMDLSDRYLLRLFSGLDAVAVYGVGYKFGMIVQVAIVWPFQLAWPAFSFSISNHAGHQTTYARALTYLATVMVVSVLFLSLLTPMALPHVVGTAYQGAAAVVPLVALAYAFNGVYYCLSPGVHIAGYTRYLSLLAACAALLNIGLNLILIPRLGMIGAAWSTLIAFACLAAATGVLAQRVYPVAYEYTRLAKLVGAAAAVYGAANALSPETAGLAIAWRLGVPAVAFPALLAASGFLARDERLQLTGWVRRYMPVLGQG